MWLESPVSVGFSYWPNASLPVAINDTQVADDNVEALLQFYARFPSMQSAPLFISGESYAGVYVPMFAAAILASPAAGTIPLKGILVGNGAAATGDWYEGGLVEQRARWQFQHGLFSPALMAALDSNCTNWVNRSDACNGLLDEMAIQVGPINVYDMMQTVSG